MLLRHVANIDAIHQDIATVYIVKARDQTNHGRFARARASDDSRDLTWAGAERNVGERRFLRAGIAKGHIVELDISTLLFTRLVSAFYLFGILDFRLHSQHLVNSIRGCYGSWKHNEHHRNHQQREQNEHGILEEREERTYLHVSIVDTNGAEPENCNAGNVQNQEHH